MKTADLNSPPFHKVDMSRYLCNEDYEVILKPLCKIMVYYCDETLSNITVSQDPEILENVLYEIEVFSSIMDYCNMYIDGHYADFSIPRWFLIGLLQYLLREKIWEPLSFITSLIKECNENI
jgi:hypothetical protein